MVSVIVPAYNAERTIQKCLDSLLKQDYSGFYEVIVVDDGSTDTTPQLVSQYPGVRVLRQQNAGPAAARNKGAREGRGDIIFFTDADCEVSPSWIKEMTEPFQKDPQIVGVKGVYRTRQKELIARFVQLEYEDKYDKMSREKYIDFIDTYSAAFKKDIFLKAGGYDLSFPVACAEDVDLSYRLAAEGYKMVFNPGAWVFHIHPNTLKDYLRKKFKFAYWRVKAVRKNPDKIIRDSHTPSVMKWQVILFLLTAAAVPLGVVYGHVLSLLLLIYFMTTIPFVIKAVKKDAAVGLLSPLLLFLRSGAQAFGLIGGILRERARPC